LPRAAPDSANAAPATTANVLPAAEAKPRTDLKSLERAHILETLAAVNGVRKAAAERLGMSERTLRYKLQQYRLDEAERQNPAAPAYKKR